MYLPIITDGMYLRGLINFISLIIITNIVGLDAIEHFFAYCYRENNNIWEKCVDF